MLKYVLCEYVHDAEEGRRTVMNWFDCFVGFSRRVLLFLRCMCLINIAIVAMSCCLLCIRSCSGIFVGGYLEGKDFCLQGLWGLWGDHEVEQEWSQVHQIHSSQQFHWKDPGSVQQWCQTGLFQFVCFFFLSFTLSLSMCVCVGYLVLTLCFNLCWFGLY